MDAPRSLATAEEIHSHLVDELNQALRRPGMFGGEMALRIMVNHLLIAERQPDGLEAQTQVWKARGAWPSMGMTGAFLPLIPSRNYDSGMASVYAEFARDRGWLKPDHVLPDRDFAFLRRRARHWAGRDRTWPDVTAEFGEPSILFGGRNPLYGKTLGYISEDPQDPLVAFHLWNGSAPGTAPWPPDHEQPLLLAVRYGNGAFRQTFTFTPEGKRKLQWCQPG